jgi:uncharacterized repeat protein (TIGR01451 family)
MGDGRKKEASMIGREGRCFARGAGAAPRRGPGARSLALLAALGWLFPGAPALAEVTLETSVMKVESTLDNAGRVKRELLATDDVVPGEELRYSIRFTNESAGPVDAQRIIITNPVPEGTRYVSGSAGGDGTVVEYSLDGEQFDATEPVAGAAPAAGEASTAQGTPAGGVHSLRWTYQRRLGPGDSGEVYFHVRML